MRVHTPAIAAAWLLLPITTIAADPPATTAVAAPTAVPSASAAATSDTAAVTRAAHSLGYKERRHDGKAVYCKSETKVGATFPSLTCMSEDQVMASVKRSEGNKGSVEALQRAFRAGPPPMQPQMGMRGN